MTAARSLFLLIFRSPLHAWCLALACTLAVPLTWQHFAWPHDLSPWLGAWWQWLNLPWMIVVASWAAIAWTRRSAIAYKTGVARDIYSAAYRTLPDAAGITSLKDGRFIDVNPALCSMLGVKPENIIGRTNDEMRIYATPHERSKLLYALALHGQVDRMRILCQAHGEVVPGTISAIPIQVSEEPCLLFVFHDTREHDKAVNELHAVNRQLQQAGHLARLGAWEDRRGEGLVYWSDVCYDIHGVPRGAPLPKDYLNTFVAPEYRDRMRSQLQHCLRARREWELEIQIIRADGRRLWVRSRGEAVMDGDGKIIAMRGVMQDIDDHKSQEAFTRDREALLAVTLEAAALGRWDWNLETGVITGDTFWCSLHGEPLPNSTCALSQTSSAWHWTEFMNEEDVARCNSELMRHINHPDAGPFDITWRIHSPSVPLRWLRSIGKVVHFDASGQAMRMLGVCLDVTAQQEQKNNLQRLAHFDPLTGLANRVELAARLNEALVSAQDNAQTLGVVYLDLDGFKPINDRLGHNAGDRLLVLVAQRLERALRDNDCVARFGGDEFVLLLTQLNSRQECEALLQRLMESVSRPYFLDKEFVQITASMGYTLYPEDHSDGDTLIRHADQAMYQAKQTGRNRVRAFDSTEERNKRELRIKHIRLQEALDRSEFVLYLQPKVDMRAHEVIGVEALARWLHPEKGLLAPGEFLAQIEGTELEIPFGEWAITAVIQTIEQLLEKGLEIQVAANVSARHLQHPGFAQWVTELLAAHPHIPAHLLDLEITESAALYDIDRVAEVLEQLRALKVSISLDDFGTGYSSLAYLRNLPLDSLKIDRSFVRAMLTDQADLAIVSGVASLAKSFGYQVIAEGVENEEQSACLARMGCHLVQGYLFAKPMPLEQLPQWLDTWEQSSQARCMEFSSA